MKTFEINGRRIGLGHPAYIVAELSANHGQSFEEALRLVRAAKASGADAVKVQAFTADSLTLDSPLDAFRVKGSIWDGRTLYELYREAAMPYEWIPKLKKYADEEGIDFFSSVFDEEGLRFLEKIDLPAYKVASCESVDLPLIAAIAATGKPVMISVGMASWEEIEDVIRTVRDNSKVPPILLKCTSAYPTKPKDANLAAIPDMIKKTGLLIGWSDHTLSTSLASNAVMLGATVIEKHFILSKTRKTADSAFSLDPEGFRAMVEAIRAAEKAVGQAVYGSVLSEAPAVLVRRSLYAVRDIKQGEKFSPENIRSIRPAGGLKPKYLPRLVGRLSPRKIAKGMPILPEDLGESEKN